MDGKDFLKRMNGAPVVKQDRESDDGVDVVKRQKAALHGAGRQNAEKQEAKPQSTASEGQALDPNERAIDTRVYERKNSSFRVTAYTAEWCAPCKRIKPVFEKLMEDNGYKEVFHSTHPIWFHRQEELGKIPMFRIEGILDNGGFVSTEDLGSIQTSNEVNITSFFNELFNSPRSTWTCVGRDVC